MSRLEDLPNESSKSGRGSGDGSSRVRSSWSLSSCGQPDEGIKASLYPDSPMRRLSLGIRGRSRSDTGRRVIHLSEKLRHEVICPVLERETLHIVIHVVMSLLMAIGYHIGAHLSCESSKDVCTSSARCVAAARGVGEGGALAEHRP
eukprot:scaffold202780_cov32-Tisochrysis_lutea.AAC.1